MLGNTRRMEHLKHEDRAAPATHKPAAHTRVTLCGCVCVSGPNMSVNPHQQNQTLQPASGQRSKGGCVRTPGTELRTDDRKVKDYRSQSLKIRTASSPKPRGLCQNKERSSWIYAVVVFYFVLITENCLKSINHVQKSQVTCYG